MSRSYRSTSQRVADALRSAPDTLDDVARARLERNLVEAWRCRGAHAVAFPRSKPALSRTLWMGSLAAAAAFGLAFGLMLLRNQASSPTAAEVQSLAHFDLVIGDGAVQSGTLSAGQVLESGKHGHIEVSTASSRVDIAPESRVRFDKLDRDDVRLSLVTGRVDVAFHPERRGEQTLAVETGSARVSVVGTRFAVEVDAQRATRVSVSEGVVRVEPRRGGPALLVRAGEQAHVPAQAEPQLTKQPPPQPPPTAAEPTGEATPAPAAPLQRARKASAASTIRKKNFEARLETARQELLAGKHAAARDRLQKLILGDDLPDAARVEAWVLIAESLTAQGQVPRAAAAYRQAVAAAPNQPAGHNAQFALARLLDRYTADDENAAQAYSEYLTKAPHGALARQARDALCRLSKCP